MADGAQGTQGVQGTQGDIGSQGSQGVQGDIGNQGNQGNQGPRGFQGYQGTTGTKGTFGNQGVQGIDGSQGAQGTQGIRGRTGSQGPRGNGGTGGNQGNQGPLGTGAQGATGAQGVQGAAGSAGAQGPQGNQGASGSGVLKAFSLTLLDLTHNTVLTDVPGLSVNIEANSVYAFSAFLMVSDSKIGQQNLRLKFTLPSSSLGYYQIHVQEYIDASQPFAAVTIYGKSSYVNQSITLNGAVSGELYIITITGNIITDVDAGIAKIQCAQVADNAGALVILPGSYITMIKN